MITPKQTRLIHTAKRALRLSDDDYRAILRTVAGVNSSKQLDGVGFSAVMRRFRDLGFKTTFGSDNLADRPGMASAGQVALMRQLWQEFTAGQGTDAQLGKWLDGHFSVSALRFVDQHTAHRAIGALRAMVKRRAGEKRHAEA